MVGYAEKLIKHEMLDFRANIFHNFFEKKKHKIEIFGTTVENFTNLRPPSPPPSQGLFTNFEYITFFGVLIKETFYIKGLSRKKSMTRNN